MPDRNPDAPQSAGLITALTWAGVGLAPVAAIVVLLGGSDDSVRFAVLLIAVCVVMLGASLLIRNDPVLLRMDVEDRVSAEVDALRGELREEIAAAARATGHRVQVLQDEMSRLRAAGSPATALSPARPAGARAAATVAPPPPAGQTSVARIPAVVTASASVGAASVPRQRAVAVVSPSYQSPPEPIMRRAGRGSVAGQRPSRRHAAPDTGTDLARFGAGSPASDRGYDEGAGHGYDAASGYGLAGGYADPVAEDRTGRADQYGPDPMTAQDDWGRRTRDPYGRW